MLVSIVIPCYNSEQTIGTVVDLCNAEFEKMQDYDCEIILVNDYSKDGTFRVIQECVKKYPNVKGINLAKNFGQHAAIMAGLHYVNGDLVVGMDDDMQNHPDQIKEFLRKQEEGYDIVFGVFEERKFSWFKNFTGAISRFLLWHLLERPKDIQMSSFWLARRYVIEQVKKYEGEQVFIQLLFFRTTHNMANIVIQHYEREYGQSNYDLRKGLKLFLSFMNYTALPLRLSTYLGVLFSCTGFIGAVALIIQKLLDPEIVIGWSSIMCAMLIFFGILLLMVGVMGEYIGKIILNVNKMPQYVIREVLDAGEAVSGADPVRAGSADLTGASALNSAEMSGAGSADLTEASALNSAGMSKTGCTEANGAGRTGTPADPAQGRLEAAVSSERPEMRDR